MVYRSLLIVLVCTACGLVSRFPSASGLSFNPFASRSFNLASNFKDIYHFEGGVNMAGKVFNCPIHGHMSLHPLSVKVMDTPQYQRLRDISQLGGVYYVFPAAASKRFEHSLGVAHLARTFIEQIRANQPGLGITDEEALCIELAGLCHDLGHGPFSHTFDGRVLPSLGAPSTFCHEHASVQIFELLIESNGLRPEFAKYGLDDSKIQLIKELILGDEDEAIGLEDFKWIGLEPRKAFLYDIVANKRNGIDVDKMDYFQRDSLMLNIPCSFDCNRLMKFASVYPVRSGEEGEKEEEMRTQICFHVKEAWNCFEMYHTRHSLYKRAYLHKVSNAIDIMISQALIQANPHITLPGVDGVPKRMSEIWNDMEAYYKYTEFILKMIQHSTFYALRCYFRERMATLTSPPPSSLSDYLLHTIPLIVLPSLSPATGTDPALAPSRAIISNLLNRALYVNCGELLLSKEQSQHIKADSVLEGLRDMNNRMKKHSPSPDVDVSNISDDDIFISIVKMGYGSGARNPVTEGTTFYMPAKHSSFSQQDQNGDDGPDGFDSIERTSDGTFLGCVQSQSVSRMLPVEFEEKYLRVFASSKEKRVGVQKLFRTYCLEMLERDPVPISRSPQSNTKKRKMTQSEEQNSLFTDADI